MLTRTLVRWLGAALVAVAALFPATVTVSAQTSTGTIRGYVTNQENAPIAGAEVQARNPETGVSRSTTSRADGSYTLPGLVPAVYELSVRHIGSAPQARRVRVQIGATALENFTLSDKAVELEEVTAVAAAPAVETRTSEVATNVTTEQIERLPTSSRNFLDLAALAPGVTIADDRLNGTGFKTFQGGGQSPNSTNVFIDGTSLKNDLTGGGVSGQDASRGNPFPRNAIQEYRVISQNFKAEYQKASSSIITATTKSGGNIWSGNAFFSYQDKGLVALDSIQKAQKKADPNFKEPDYSRYLAGFDFGGPIIRDKLHVFGSYEGNYQNRANLVDFAPPTTGLFPALDTVNLSQYNGNFQSPFRETLVFGKASYSVNPNSTAELSFSHRRETDARDFGRFCCTTVRSFQSAVNFRQNTSIGQLKYNWFSGPWLNEAKIDYSRFRRNPSPDTQGLPSRVFQFGGADNQIGSFLSTQDFTQRRIGLRNDLTYSGFQLAGQHTIKGGVSFDFVKYDVVKDNDGTPRFMYRDSANGQSYAFRNPYQLVYGTGDPNLSKNNNEIGVYLQDDWSPIPRLTINAGIRWDFESKMLNYDYVTPQTVVDTLTRYNDSLPTPLNLNRYISTGNSRKPFYGAFQPRVGFSYALDKENRTTVFGGFGIYYDRTLFDVSVDETLKLTHPTYTINFAAPGVAPGPGEVAWDDAFLTASKAQLDQLVHSQGVPEAWLIDKDAKVPKSRQWNLGVRQVLGQFTVSAAYTGVRGVDQFTLNWANFGLNPDKTCCTSFNLAAHGFSNFIYSSNDAKTWYDALQIQVDRPYRPKRGGIGWGAGLAFTYAERSLLGVDGLGDLFAFPNTIGINKHPANDERARIVANWITDVPYLWGIQFSGLLTLGSGNKQDQGCPARFCPNDYKRGAYSPPGKNFLIFGKWVYRNIDFRLRKDFPDFAGTRLGITVDAFNIFNFQNDGCFDTGGTPASNANYGHPGCIVSDPRRFQFGFEYGF
jgi:carboxypeptidase family protein/TonB-dependent receptor-like protein